MYVGYITFALPNSLRSKYKFQFQTNIVDLDIEA